MRALWLLALCASSGAWAHPNQGYAEFQGINGTVRLTGFAGVSVKSGGVIQGSATGKMVTLEDTGRGMKLTGKSMDVTLRQNALGKTEVVLAKVAGGSEAFFGSVNKASGEATQTHLVTESFSYSLEGSEGTLTVPNKLVLDSTSTGKGTRTVEKKVLPTTYTQVLHLTGSSAVLTFAPNATESLDKPRTGHIEGPVTFTLDRHEVASNGPEDSHVDGVCDFLTFDFVTPPDPTIVAKGNVTVNAKSTAFTGRVTGSQATITLDRATLEPKQYEFAGEPAETRLNLKEIGH